ncbi:MAG: hypothetical protein CVU38_04480 [Chloroflexi bacterium HGW-Chloroflexi-1]|nr:MAG: hypothetical protein CVU38_04480 [Chloroflexi bacterium HGW-Chloroflexi-1]
MVDDSMVPEIAGATDAVATAQSPASSRLWRGLQLNLFSPRGMDAGTGLALRTVMIEWAILAAVVFIFCTVFLSFDDTRVLPGNEADIVQSLDWTLVNGLKQFGQFPLWNPYLRSGFPYVADPFLHVYNPLATLPVLVFGVWNGFKVALFLSFLAAALGMWWLGVVLRLGRPARLWMGLMYAFTGQAVARFFQGEYDFVLGFAWIPWVLAFILLAMRTRQRRHVLGAVVTLALLFFSGNVYYTFYMAFVIALLAFVGVVGSDWTGRRLGWRGRALLIVVVIVLLALGLTAIQWLPMVDYWTSYTKMPDTQLVGSHSLPQIWLDYVSKDHQRPDAFKMLPSEEFYAYTGVWPFLLLAFLPLAIRRGDRRALVFLGLLLLMSVAYVATRYMPWAQLYRESAFLSQFRYQTRMLIYGVVALIALAGCGLDAIWRRVGTLPQLSRVSVPDLARWIFVRLGAIVLLGFMFWSVADVYSTNRVHARARVLYAPPYELVGWLRQYDDAVFYMDTPHGWHGPIVSNGIRYLDAWYGLAPLLPTQGAMNARLVRARPNYVALGNDRMPDSPGELVQQFSEHTIWRMPESLPFAFTVSDALLRDPAGGVELAATDVRAVQPALASPNRITMQAEGTEGETVVVLTSAYRGWRLTIDGRPASLRNVGGYLAASVQPGTHRYEFSFGPSSFWVGLLVSVTTILGLVVFAVVDGRSKRWRFRTNAVYAGGVLRPAMLLDLPDDTPVRVTVEPYDEPSPGGGAGTPGALEAETESPGLARLGWVLFGLGMFVYLLTRLWHIDQFPIYFFTDEATFTLLAQDLLSRGLRDGRGTLLPIYFEVAGNRWTPVLAVYEHLPAVAWFGKSIVATRATSALVTLLVPLAVSFTLKLIFRIRYWWVGAALVATVPTWFLHSRTAFEWLTMASLYACFILCYLLYRTRSPKFLFLAIVFGAATFYNHASGQLVMAASAGLLVASDFRYHLKNWRTILLGLLLVALLAVPLLRLQSEQPGAMLTHLRVINSYWFRDAPLVDKLRQFASTYAYGLSPNYWFFPNEHDLVRHRMRGYGNLGWVMLPFVLAGALLCLRRVRSSTHRAVLLAALAAPVGAATTDVAITRMMAFIPPACIIAGLGLDLLLEWFRQALQALREGLGARRSRDGYSILAVAIFVVLSGASLAMLRDALSNGPTWYNDYGLYGMQYGARQLFTEAIPQYLKAEPETTVIVSPNWANGTDTFVRFFLPQNQQFSRVQMHDARYFMEKRQDLTPNMVLVMQSNEYEQVKASLKFSRVDVEQVIPYPDGSPGFYFVRLAYADNFDALLAAERAERAKPVVTPYVLDGQQIQVSHSQLDIGQLRNLFDNDRFTLARGLEANPLVFDFAFPQPRPMTGLAADFGSMDFTLTVRLYASGAAEPIVYSQTYRGLPPDPHVELAFDRGSNAAVRARVEILQLNAGDEVHIHVRELTFK